MFIPTPMSPAPTDHPVAVTFPFPRAEQKRNPEPDLEKGPVQEVSDAPAITPAAKPAVATESTR